MRIVPERSRANGPALRTSLIMKTFNGNWSTYFGAASKCTTTVTKASTLTEGFGRSCRRREGTYCMQRAICSVAYLRSQGSHY